LSDNLEIAAKSSGFLAGTSIRHDQMVVTSEKRDTNAHESEGRVVCSPRGPKQATIGLPDCWQTGRSWRTVRARKYVVKADKSAQTKMAMVLIYGVNSRYSFFIASLGHEKFSRIAELAGRTLQLQFVF
jgi:hypothetical protein